MEIPSDIMKAAVAVVDRGYDTGLIDAVAAALMAERARCAKIADEQEAYHLSYGIASEAVRAGTANMIAARIRTPSTGEET